MSKEHDVTKWFQMFLYSLRIVCEPLNVIPVAFVFMCVDIILVDARGSVYAFYFVSRLVVFDVNRLLCLLN